DAKTQIVSTVTYTAMNPNSTTSGITSNNNDVKLTVLAGGLVIGEAAVKTDDITLGAGNLTLNVTGAVTQTAGNVITAAGLQLLGSGSVHLDEPANNVATLAAGYSGPISYTDANALVVGTVTDTAMTPSTTTSGITSSGNDVKLTVLAGGLVIGEAAVSTDDITLGAGNLTLNVTGNVTQTDGSTDDITLGLGNLTLNVTANVTQISGNVITAACLQLLGSGSVHLDEPPNNVATLSASYSGTISYTDANTLVIGTVTDTAMTP